MKIIVLSMETKVGEKRRKLLNYDYEWFKSITPEADFEDKFIFRYNTGEKRKKGTMGCFASHIAIMKYIVDNKIDDVVVCEDDSFKVRDFDNNSIKDICLLGGIIRHPTSWSKDKDFQKNNDIVFNDGVNKIDYDRYRWTHTFAIYYPNWEKTSELLNNILQSKKKYRPIDIFLSKNKLINHLYYPTPFIHNDIEGVSQIGNSQGIIYNYKNLGKDKKTFDNFLHK